MPTYHFSLGNSTDGPIGFCARIRADSEEAAIERLKAQLCDTEVSIDDREDGEYIEVYFNADAVKASDIDEVDDDELEEDDEPNAASETAAAQPL